MLELDAWHCRELRFKAEKGEFNDIHVYTGTYYVIVKERHETIMGYKPRERVALEWFIPIIVELLELVTRSVVFEMTNSNKSVFIDRNTSHIKHGWQEKRMIMEYNACVSCALIGQNFPTVLQLT